MNSVVEIILITQLIHDHLFTSNIRKGTMQKIVIQNNNN